MSSFWRVPAIACSFLLLLSAFTAKPSAAAETQLSAIAAPELKVSQKLAANVALQAPPAPNKPMVVALQERGKPSSNSTVSSPTDLLSAPPTWSAPAKFFTINQVLAKRKRLGGGDSVSVASINPKISDFPTIPPVQGSEPFGLFTFRAPEGLLWMKWRKVEADIKAESPILAECRAEPDHCSPAEAKFTAIVKEAALKTGRDRIEFVNERINGSIQYTSDLVQWHEPDVWSAPFDLNNNGSLQTGLGDCEDYAIAKYVALRESGVEETDLRLLLVRDKSIRMDHAVLAARQDGHWLILDNRWSRLSEDSDLKQFEPLFALNDDGVKLFAAPYAARYGNPTDGGSFSDQFFSAGNASTDEAEVTDVAPISSASSPIFIKSEITPSGSVKDDFGESEIAALYRVFLF